MQGGKHEDALPQTEMIRAAVWFDIWSVSAACQRHCCGASVFVGSSFHFLYPDWLNCRGGLNTLKVWHNKKARQPDNQQFVPSNADHSRCGRQMVAGITFDATLLFQHFLSSYIVCSPPMHPPGVACGYSDLNLVFFFLSSLVKLTVILDFF